MSLNHREWVEHGKTLSPGTTCHIHHCKLGKGNDRLYITRTPDGRSLLAFCHHCGGKGVYHFAGWVSTRAVAKPLPTASGVCLPYDATPELPLAAEHWLKSYDIQPPDWNRHGIVYSKWKGRLILPNYRNGKLLSYAARSLDGSKPKYLTVGSTRIGKLVERGSSRLALVEDFLSAIKCGHHCDSYALGGVHLSDEAFDLILKNNYTHYSVFLDNDNRKVRLQQLKLFTRLQPHGIVEVVKADRDPKEHTHEELEDILWT
jgi:hypothetical protein